MQIEIIESYSKSCIIREATMAAASIPVLESVEPWDLATKMDISIDSLALAVDADTGTLSKNPRNTGREDQLRLVSDLWKNLIILVGDEKRARLFLKCKRPELNGKTPLFYLEDGQPGVVFDLIMAMSELIP